MSKSRLLTPVLLATITAITALMPVSTAWAACSDCPWLFVRCMRMADTPEKEQACEEARALCEETFCGNPFAARDALLPARVENPLVKADPVDPAEARDARRSAR